MEVMKIEGMEHFRTLLKHIVKRNCLTELMKIEEKAEKSRSERSSYDSYAIELAESE